MLLSFSHFLKTFYDPEGVLTSLQGNMPLSQKNKNHKTGPQLHLHVSLGQNIEAGGGEDTES